MDIDELDRLLARQRERDTEIMSEDDTVADELERLTKEQIERRSAIAEAARRLCYRPVNSGEDMSAERNYYAEAVAIMSGVSIMIPEKAHLDALQEHHEVTLIRIANRAEEFKRSILKG